jgi:type IV pilus biogenesis protein CpaD/CtpE
MSTNQGTKGARTKRPVWIRIAGSLAGIIAFLALLVAFLQLRQAVRDSKAADAANATVIAVLGAQLQVQEEIATFQASSVKTGPTATVVAQEVAKLVATRDALEEEGREARATLAAVTSKVTIRPSPTLELTTIPQASPSASPMPTPTIEPFVAKSTVVGSNLTIAFGQPISGTIATAGDTDMYTFTANAGDVILAGMGRVSDHLWPKIRLYDPEGNLLNTGSGSYNTEITGTLSVAGIHAILVSDGYDGTRTGDYNLCLQRLNNPINAIPLSPGQTVSSAIDVSVKMGIYTFTANAGDTILIGMGRVSGSLWPKIRLYDPEGGLLNTESDSYHAEITETLSATGIHTIIVSDGYDGTRTGEYSINLQKLP